MLLKEHGRKKGGTKKGKRERESMCVFDRVKERESVRESACV